MKIHSRFSGSRVVSLDAAVCMWTLASNMAAEWTPRTCLRTEAEVAETSGDDKLIAFRDGRPTPLMQALLEALAPFADARRAVADALKQFAGPLPGGAP